jgi:hypothetical protein
MRTGCFAAATDLAGAQGTADMSEASVTQH